MKSSKPLLISLSLHLFLFILAWGALSAVRKIPEPEKIRVALLLRTPMVSQITPPKPMAPMPVKTPEAPKPLETSKLSQKVPTPPAVTAAKVVSAPSATPTVTPAVAKTAPAEPVVVKAPPPPPVNIQADYEEENLGRIRSLLSERLKYPKNALRLRQQGSVTITFTLSSSGDVSAITITKSSDFEMLDDAARTLIESTASAFPKPSKSVRISVPIDYKIR